METSMLGFGSFPCYTPPNRSLPKLRILSMRQQFPLASKIVVKNLPYFTGENTLQKEFSNFGKIAEVNMVKDVITERSKGLAFIQYTSQDDAMLALENMDQKNFHGRTISVKLVKLDPYELHGLPPRASGPPKKCNLPEPRASGLPKKCNLPEPRASGPPKKCNLPEPRASGPPKKCNLPEPRASGPPKKCNLPEPRASGPPKKFNLLEPRKWNLPEEHVEDVDCWYWSNFKFIKP